MKGTILEFTKKDNSFCIKKHTKYGTFTGKVVLHPEDKDVASDYVGFQFAEQKCDIQAYHVKTHWMLERAKGAEHAYNVILKSGVDPEDEIMVKLEQQVNVAWREYVRTKEVYQNLKESYLAWVAFIQESRRRVRQWEKNKKYD